MMNKGLKCSIYIVTKKEGFVVKIYFDKHYRDFGSQLFFTFVA